ncbi:MAG: hypothetical protein ACXVFQ_16970 [Solirubrobacteraceae bacterium]
MLAGADHFYKALASRGTRARAGAFVKLGEGTRWDLEIRLGDYPPGLAQDLAMTNERLQER